MATRAERRRDLRIAHKVFAQKGTKKDRREFRKNLHIIAGDKSFQESELAQRVKR